MDTKNHGIVTLDMLNAFIKRKMLESLCSERVIIKTCRFSVGTLYKIVTRLYSNFTYCKDN